LSRGRSARAAASTPASFDEQLVTISDAFDRDFYCDAYADVAAGRLDPVIHYMVAGWREGRDPAPWFSTSAYLARRPEAAQDGTNPFFHYLTVGRGRSARPPAADWRRAYRRSQPGVPERVAAARRRAPAYEVSSAEALRAALTGVTEAHVTISQDDFSKVVGGVQLCIGREAQMLAGVRPHLHLFPAVQLPTVSDDPDYAVMVLLDARPIGAFAISDLAVLAEVLAPAGRSTIAAHSLLGHHPERLAEALAACRPAHAFFWVHDFAAACDGYTLLKNDEAFCGGPPPGSATCGTCLYGPLRARHLAGHDAFLARLRPQIVAPSAAAAEIWSRARGAPLDRIVVHPHAAIELDTPSQAAGRPLNVAFPGLPLPHKGWPAFRALAEALAEDSRYAFHHFADTPDLRSRATFHRVAVSAERPTAMSDAMAAAEIDLAVIWSICPETFCLTAHEAVAAGARLVAFADSGAAAALAREPGRGVVLDSDQALIDFFRSGQALKLAGVRRLPGGHLALSGMSADFLPEARHG
jgi:hypothetical protein